MTDKETMDGILKRKAEDELVARAKAGCACTLHDELYIEHPPILEELIDAITELRRDLAAMTAERNQAVKDRNRAYQGSEAQTEDKLAASQAYSQQLREALKALQQGFPQTHQINAVIRHVLALPQDDTALRQWGAKLLREMAKEDFEGIDRQWILDKADELEAGK